MISILLDTSILMRFSNSADPQNPAAVDAVIELHRRGETLHITPQVMIEFRNAATRPKSLNGAGLTIAEAEAHASKFESRFSMLPDDPDIYDQWKSIVGTLGIIGKQVHDSRLVAVCHVHAVQHMLTFNVSHFTRMAAFGPGTIVLDPTTV